MKEVTIYTDGACSQNHTWTGGWGAILIYENRHFKKISGREYNTTNSRMEIQAVLEALKRLKEPCKVEIVSDSLYVVRTINEWLTDWINTGMYSQKANIDLWDEFIKLKQIHEVTAKHIRGHHGNYYNEIADKLAVNAIKGVDVND
ncbi:MAG: RNase H family protein [Bacilli bacterium]